MIFSSEIARKLEALIHPEVEAAIKLLLEHVLAEKEAVFTNPLATDAELRQFQGQRTLIKELLQYRNRLNDAVKREKDGSE